MNTYYPQESSNFRSSSMVENLLDAFKRGKKGARFVRFDGKKAVFQQFRPHEVLSFGLVYEDPTGAPRLIASGQPDIAPFVLLCRSQKSGDTACFMSGDGTEFTSDDQTNFAAFFCVQFKELDHPTLYTVSKLGNECKCVECHSTQDALPLHFCFSIFALLGGVLHGEN